MAFLIPAALFLLCLVKKLTVIGIIGNTQGVNNAAKPDKKAIKKIPSKLLLGDLDFFCFSPEVKTWLLSALEGFSATVLFFNIENFKSTKVGGKQLASSQTINSTSPIIVEAFSFSNLTRCLKVALFSKYLIFISKTGSSTV